MHPHHRSLSLLLKSKGIGVEPFKAAEIGVHLGQASAYLLQAFPTMHLLMVDPWLAPQLGTEWYESLKFRPSQSVMDGIMETAVLNTDFASARRTVIRSNSVEAARQVKDGSLLLAFIDGDHTEAAVLQDMDVWWPKMKQGGLFSGHDYYNPRLGGGVRKAVGAWSEANKMAISTARGGVWFCWKS